MKTSSQFTFDCTEKTLTAEMSDLRGFDYLSDDSYTVGIVLEGRNIGAVSKWVITGREVEDGDTLLWTLTPDAQSISEYPSLAGWVMTIFND